MTAPLSPLEQLKADSRLLRGTIQEGLADPLTGAISEDDNKLLKFHGSYQQDDRDLRDERRKQKLEPAYSFMIRARLAGGVVSPTQWLAFDDLARQYAGRGLRITTRQTFQWHGVIKRNLKPTLRAINDALATTIAACGDVNRQVVCSVNPWLSNTHAEIAQWAQKLSDHFLPKTRAYHEIWLDGEKVEFNADEPEAEPLYGPTYLPRKFKIGIAVPPFNDVDVFAQDVGLIAIVSDGKLEGFNLSIGGGMGASHGDATTYPRVGSVVGFVTQEQVIAAVESVMILQRDLGNRDERRYARLKYTIDRIGLTAFVEKLQALAGFTLAPAREFTFQSNHDHYGWFKGDNDLWHLGLHVESGRLWDADPLSRNALEPDTQQRLWQTGLREIAKTHEGDFLLTCNQNVVIANVKSADRKRINALIKKYGLNTGETFSALRQHSIACVALPTCGLAMAESERYLPELLPKMEALLDKHGLRNTPITLRLSGCPNGCSRPYLAEIALVGRAPGRYDLRLGANAEGSRLNRIYAENIDEPQILATLDELLGRYAAERTSNEGFGDFIVRTQEVPA
ncbi:assimilatory sulfite reductase (NADPH) hemoprotein subunit [Pusillimonas sp. DMV24BSW_D]|uniref:assimilatory sulfite reductase (NADPH) hemoprotein subunit n=1 Tax=Neopusillimonas aestuarii TaxID=2716226 RepID=UPI0014090355|nr:assimilatory sulfite reductase (NADPH) hemoprotein subunit [Pusillimonas sp. DMV24BSW_D]QIM48114.1 assimilatory sulfite reductase (NADPH) hemoprotein subunit [Pusillimonas sp. DMV24BSW_D]